MKAAFVALFLGPLKHYDRGVSDTLRGMKPLEPPDVTGATCEDFLADLERQKKVIDRKSHLLGVASFLLLFALVMPRESWQGSALVSTVFMLVGTLLAQYFSFRGTFDRLTVRFFGKPYGLTLYVLILTCILCIRAVYGLVVHHWTTAR